jgi:eukaryotic-like serine/threonine-protein kinase
VLAYAVGSSGSLTQLTWFDRTGKPAGVVGEPAVIRDFALSPDGQRVAVSLVRTSSVGRSQDIWVIDPGRSIDSRLTFDDGNGNSAYPVWSPDGGRIFFSHYAPGTTSSGDSLQRKAVEGTGQAEVLLKDAMRPGSASRDGRYLAGTKLRPNASADVWVTPLFGERKPFPIMQTPFRERHPSFSPDARWLAYTSNESGQDQVYVVPFPATGRKFQVSAAGGSSPQWRQDGKELFFLGPDGALMAALVTSAGGFETAAPQLLFQSISGVDMFDRAAFVVNADGSRFLFNVPQKGGAQGEISVIVNWPAMLQK